MADNGQLYSIFNQEYVDAMRVLCSEADILVPNITEACFLTGERYAETYDEAYVLSLVTKLAALGAKTVVLTGVSYEAGKTGVVIYENGKMDYYRHDKISKGCHGTGDIYASAFVGALMNDKSVYDAAKIAADYTVKCICNTQGDAEHWYGAKFETALADLIEMVK
jgi:pyridoxine kinase